MSEVPSQLESVVLSGKARGSSRGDSWEFGHVFTHSFNGYFLGTELYAVYRGSTNEKTGDALSLWSVASIGKERHKQTNE